MKIGLIMKGEQYWSLQKISESVLNCLEKKHEVMSLRLKNNSIKSQKHLDNLYEKCDAVIYMASKLITFTRICDKPTFFFTHAWMDHGAGINFYVNKKTFKRNDVLLFTSSSAKNKFNQVYSTNISRAVIPYFTTNQKIKLKSGEEKYLRAKYKIPDNSKILMYFGRFSPEKNIEALFDMVKRLQNRNFVMLAVGEFTDESTFGFGEMGEKSYKEKIKKMIASEKSEKILFINKIDSDDLYRLISIAFITINPTLCLEEDFSLSAVESMSVGVPVIASNWGGLKDIVRTKRNGFLMRTYFSGDNKVRLDINGAVNYIDKLLSHKINRENLSKSSLERYKKVFSETAFLRSIDSLITNANKNKIIGDKVFIHPRAKYESIYKSALRCGGVKTIYLDNPWLFKELYKNYLGNQK